MTYLIVPQKISERNTQFWPFPIWSLAKLYFPLIIIFSQMKAVLQVILMWNYLVKILCRWNNIIKNGYNSIKLDVRAITVDK